MAEGLASRDMSTGELGVDEFEDIHQLFGPKKARFGGLSGEIPKDD